jgi:hypothetical protein
MAGEEVYSIHRMAEVVGGLAASVQPIDSQQCQDTDVPALSIDTALEPLGAPQMRLETKRHRIIA